MANNQDTKNILSEFSRRALQRLEDKRTPKQATLFVPSLDMEIKVRSLTKAEKHECMNMEDGDDRMHTDRYIAYIGIVEPNLRETATELKKAESIKEPLEVMDVFRDKEVSEIAHQIMELTGVLGGKAVTVVDDLKN